MSRKTQKQIRQLKQKLIKDLVYFIFCGLIFSGLVQSVKPSVSRIYHDVTTVFLKKTSGKVYAKEVMPKPTQSQTDRAKKLQAMLVAKNSPLADYADLIVEEADTYDIGWTKLYAISGMESKFATLMPEGSYNAWGLGGDNFMWFSSWDESIRYASRLLGQDYQWNANAGIKEKYCPASDNCNPEWASQVTAYQQEVLGE